MKSLVLFFALVFAAQAQVIMPNGQMVEAFPRTLETPTGRIDIATPAQWIEAGGRYATAQEIAAYASAKAAAALAAQAEAEAQAELPMQSATGFAALDEDGHWVELLPTGDGLPIIGVQVSNSPLTAEQRAAMKAQRKAAHDELKAKAKAAKTDKEKLAVLMKAVFGKDSQ